MFTRATLLSALSFTFCSTGPSGPAHASSPAFLMATAAAHEHGEGTPRDPGRAAALYCGLARQGVADAQYALGWMLLNGRGIARDDGAARALFALAAEQGHRQAAELLATLPVALEPALPACLAPDPPLEVDWPADPWAGPAVAGGNHPVRRLVETLAPQFDVDPELALAVIAVESGFRNDAVSPKNAQGLMQLIPETARRYDVADPFDPEANVRGGLAYLRTLLTQFDGDVALVTAAYNAGEAAVLRYRGIPPFRETQEYVRRIATLYPRKTHPLPPVRHWTR